MKKNLFNSLLVLASVCMLVLAGCQEKEANPDLSSIEIEASNDSFDGEGDSFVLTVRSNVEWELSVVDAEGNPVDWINFETTSGEGDAEVFATVNRGDRTEVRTCTVVVAQKGGSLKKTITLTQGTFTPEMYPMKLSDVIDAGSRLEVGASEGLEDYGQFKAEVVAIPGVNIPQNYIYVTDGQKNFLRVKTSQASSLTVGDKLLLEMTGGTVTKDAEGIYTADLPALLIVEEAGNPTVEPLYISADAITRYGNALVAVDFCQTKEEGAAWSGDVLMTTEIIAGGSEFTLHVAEGASFASASAQSGKIIGIVVDGKLCPRTAEDIQLNEARKPIMDGYEIRPIGNYFKFANGTFANTSVSNRRKLTFADVAGWSVAGSSVEKLMGTDDQTQIAVGVDDGAQYKTRFVTKGWTIDGSALLFTLPVNQQIYGYLEFAFSVSTADFNNFPGDFTVFWSKDNSDWKPVDAVYSTAQFTPESAQGNTFRLTSNDYNANRQVAEFYIPKAEAVSSGNLYFKVCPPKAKSDVTLRVNVGFTLSTKRFSPEDYGFDNVLAIENFERAVFGHNTVIGIPVYYIMNHAWGPTYSSTDGWEPEHNGAAVLYRGYLHMSGTSKCFMKSPALALEKPTDIYVSFKVAPSWFDKDNGKNHSRSDANITVGVDGSGTVGEIVWDNDKPFPTLDYGWHTGRVKITGASSDTRVKVGNISSSSVARYYIDDIIITK